MARIRCEDTKSVRRIVFACNDLITSPDYSNSISPNIGPISTIMPGKSCAMSKVTPPVTARLMDASAPGGRERMIDDRGHKQGCGVEQGQFRPVR
ncbi:MAG: hypothetical protein ACREUU_12945 [Gammaproteobacteria bacterium]